MTVDGDAAWANDETQSTDALHVLPGEAWVMIDKALDLTVEHLRVEYAYDPPDAPRAGAGRPPVLSRLRALQLVLAEVDDALRFEAYRAGEEGLSYAAVGKALGISKQLAHQRFRRSSPLDPPPDPSTKSRRSARPPRS